MKKLLIAVSIVVLAASCNSNSEKESPPGNQEQLSPDIIDNPASAEGDKKDALPVFDFAETTYDFGTIKSGAEVTHEYKFTNTGNADLVISQAQGSCGCTVPEYPKAPVRPGDEGVIKVTYRSEGQAGQIAKTITLLANTIPSTKVLTISGEVVK